MALTNIDINELNKELNASIKLALQGLEDFKHGMEQYILSHPNVKLFDVRKDLARDNPSQLQ